MHVLLQENAAAFFVELTKEDRTFLEEAFHPEKVSLKVLIVPLDPA